MAKKEIQKNMFVGFTKVFILAKLWKFAPKKNDGPFWSYYEF
jgi:hypothetical protein